jgi:hypothetical protein
MLHIRKIPVSTLAPKSDFPNTFRRLRINNEMPLSALYCLSARLLPTCFSAAPNGRIFLKFEAGDVKENLSRSSKFCSNQTISGTYLEELCRFLLLTTVRIFFSSTTMQGEPIIVFPWQHSTVLYCLQKHVGQQQ